MTRSMLADGARNRPSLPDFTISVKQLPNGVVFQGARLYILDEDMGFPPYVQAIASMFLERGLQKPIPVDEFPSSDSDNAELFLNIGFLLNEHKIQFTVHQGQPCLKLTKKGVAFALSVDERIRDRINRTMFCGRESSRFSVAGYRSSRGCRFRSADSS